MDTFDAVRGRRMTRRFDPDRPVDDATLRAVLDLARWAPSAGATQGTDLVVLTDDAARARYWAATAGTRRPNAWLRGVSAAPVLAIVTSHPDAYLDRYAEPDKGRTDRNLDDWPIPYWDTDAAMAAMLVLLGARDRGLGALWCGIPPTRHDAVREAFAIPAGRRLVGLLALGHPLGPTPRSPSLRRRRRTHDEVVHRDGW